MKVVQDAMRVKGINQADLAKRVGVARSTVNRWFTHGLSPDLRALEKLREHLGISIATMTGQPEWRTLTAAVEAEMGFEEAQILRMLEGRERNTKRDIVDLVSLFLRTTVGAKHVKGGSASTFMRTDESE